MKKSVKEKIIAYSVIGVLGLLVLGLSIRLVLILSKNRDAIENNSGQTVTVTETVPSGSPVAELSPTDLPSQKILPSIPRPSTQS